MKPTRPKPTAISAPAMMRTSISCVSAPPCIHRNAMQTNAEARPPMMNIRPPIVGVPCLFLCQLGPTSRIVWPNLILCRNGTMNLPSRPVISAAATTARQYKVISMMMNDPFRLPSYFYASVVPPAVSTPPALTNDTVMTVPRRTRVPAATLWPCA